MVDTGVYKNIGNFNKRPLARGKGGAVSCSNAHATKAGLDIMRAGGNAFDAAVAVSLALSVAEPQSSGLGGGMFSLIYQSESKSARLIDSRGRIPEKATRDMFLDSAGNTRDDLRTRSGISSVIPGLYRGLGSIVERYCSKDLKELSAPAIKLAREGFRISGGYETCANSERFTILARLYPGFADFYAPGGKRPVFGTLTRNPLIADVIEGVAENGVDWFYNGPIATKIVETCRKYEGILSARDLATAKTRFSEPLRGAYKGYDVYSIAPPSSGGASMIQMLNIFENFDLKAMGAGSANALHVMAEALKIAFADRSVGMTDPEYGLVKTERFISKEYAACRAREIDMNQAKEYAPDPGIEAELFSGPGHTTHFSIIDKDGNCVAQTQTVGDLFGSGVLVDDCGFVMNSLMMDSSPKAGKIVGTDKKYENVNCIEPGKMPLSSNSPTIILKDDKPVMIVGAAGGPRIIVGTIQCIVNAIEFGMPADTALRAPAIGGFTKEGGLEIEPGVSPDTVALLKAKGHEVTQGDVDTVLGFVSNAILCEDGEAYPANCYRIDGCGGAICEDGSYVFEGVRFEN